MAPCRRTCETDGELVLAVDDLLVGDILGPPVGFNLSELTGVVNYSFERFKVPPRDTDDLGL